MIYNLPLRLTTLHFAQRLRMEGPTFMISFSLPQLFNQRLNYTCTILFRPVSVVSCCLVKGQSGREDRLR
jgi:hypothetical protein